MPYEIQAADRTITCYGNTDIIKRLSHYGFGAANLSRKKLSLFTLALLDVIEEMGKGDRLVLDGIGTFEVKLEDSRWIHIPTLPLGSRYQRSIPRRWRLVFTPATELKKWIKGKCPDEVIEGREKHRKNEESRS